ncbi:hypothetical protein JCM10908_004340 [Rhodotorula pacifica]|uniref:uncharacterized protein n=1 Tax=Rhodotorula pacifica TaxID=1495444 RepID=UPI003182A7B4
MSGDAEDAPPSFSSLRARFEQLSTSTASLPPKPAPKPAALAKPLAAKPPAAYPTTKKDIAPIDETTAEPEQLIVVSSASEEPQEEVAHNVGAAGVQDSRSSPQQAAQDSRGGLSAALEGKTTNAAPTQASQAGATTAAEPVKAVVAGSGAREAHATELPEPRRPEMARTLSSTPSLRRPPPPRPSTLRPTSPFVDPESGPSGTALPSLVSKTLTVPPPSSPPRASPTPSPASSVRNLVSRFSSSGESDPQRSASEPALHTMDGSVTESAAVQMQAASQSAPLSPFAEAEAIDSDQGDEDPYSSDSTYHSSSDEDYSDEKLAYPAPRPSIPPRPAILEQPPTPDRPSVAIPALPSRPATQPSSPLASSFSPPKASPRGVMVSAESFTRSPSSSLSAGSAVPPIPARPLPPPREAQPSSLPATSDALPKLPARHPSVPSVPLPPRPAMSAPPAPEFAASSTTTAAPLSALPSAVLYVPPPPPMRAHGAADKIVPKRPTVTSAGGEGSSEGEDDETARSQEFPDATFANRRPPTHRNRRHVHTTNQFSAWTVRGSRVVTAHHRLHIWHSTSGGVSSQSFPIANDQQKFLSLEWRAADADRPEDDGRYLWCGTKEGHLYEVDVEHLSITDTRPHAHAYPITAIYRVRRAMVTVDESGKVLVWPERGGLAASLGNTPTQQRLPAQQTWTAMIGDELWTSSGPTTKAGSTAVAMRSPQIRLFDPTGSREGPFSLLTRPLVTPESAGYIGAVTSHAIVPDMDNVIYLGHDNGYISVWDRSSYTCTHVQRVAPGSVSALTGVKRFIWAGFRTGYIHVYDVSTDPWTVKKAWKAHEDPVIRLMVDPTSLWQDSTLQVASASNETVCLWDGFLREDWIDAELHLRQPDYCTFRPVRALCVTWNVDSNRPSDLHGTVDNLEFLRNVLTSVESPDIISFGFQEMIDLEDKKLTAKSMLMGKKKALDGKMSDSLSTAYRQWHDKLVQAVRMHLPADTPYTVVHVGDMIGLFSCIFVKSSEATRLRDVALVTVKTGMGGRYGNKGAILSRFVIDDSSFCFINCHLAAGQTHRRQRDRDLADILESKASFSELGSSSPGAYAPGGAGTMVFDHEMTIVSGDLNYRIDAHRDVVVSAVACGNSESLLQHDQLLKNLATNQNFRLRSFKESPIHFPPTYKYDPGTDQYDSSPKRRIPAWCDRILYRADRGEHVRPVHYQRYEVNISDHKPVSAAYDLQIKHIDSAKRAAVWQEVESAWFSVESSILDTARLYYSHH